jgi:hypothetical protein
MLRRNISRAKTPEAKSRLQAYLSRVLNWTPAKRLSLEGYAGSLGAYIPRVSDTGAGAPTRPLVTVPRESRGQPAQSLATQELEARRQMLLETSRQKVLAMPAKQEAGYARLSWVQQQQMDKIYSDRLKNIEKLAKKELISQITSQGPSQALKLSNKIAQLENPNVLKMAMPNYYQRSLVGTVPLSYLKANRPDYYKDLAPLYGQKAEEPAPAPTPQFWWSGGDLPPLRHPDPRTNPYPTGLRFPSVPAVTPATSSATEEADLKKLAAAQLAVQQGLSPGIVEADVYYQDDNALTLSGYSDTVKYGGVIVAAGLLVYALWASRKKKG